MAIPDFDVKSKEQVDAELTRALLAHALWERQEHEIDKLESESENDEQITEHVKERRPQVLALIRKEMRKKHIHTFMHKTLPVIGRSAASVLLVFFLTLTTAVATVQEVRVRVMELLVNIEREYTELSLREKAGASFTVPVEWGGEYYPAFIPEGFSVKDVHANEQNAIKSVAYWDNAGNRIFFDECRESVQTNINTEGATTEYVLINGNPGMVALNDDHCYVAWAEYEYYFVVDCDNSTKAEALAIAESVIRIK